jgi:hypothetical protein
VLFNFKPELPRESANSLKPFHHTNSTRKMSASIPIWKIAFALSS